MPYTYRSCPQPRRGTEYQRIQQKLPPFRQPSSTLPNHLILLFTHQLRTEIQQNDIEVMESTKKLLQKTRESNLKFLKYDCSDLNAASMATSDLLIIHYSSSTTNPASPRPYLLSTANNLTPVSNLLNLIHLTGGPNLQTSTPGWRPS